MKKYELTDETRVFNGHTLHRIRALRDFCDVEAGDLGGWIESERNLSHEGNSWVYQDAHVYEKAHVYRDAHVYENACVYGEAYVYGNACVYGNAEVYGESYVYGNARVYGNALVSGQATVCGNARAYENACVYGEAYIHEDARIFGFAEVYDLVLVYGNAQVSENACLYGKAQVVGNAEIKSGDDYLCIHGLGSRNRTTTFFRCSDGRIQVCCGCFIGNLDEFEAKVKETHGDSKYAREYLSVLETVKIHFDIK